MRECAGKGRPTDREVDGDRRPRRPTCRPLLLLGRRVRSSATQPTQQPSPSQAGLLLAPAHFRGTVRAAAVVLLTMLGLALLGGALLTMAPDVHRVGNKLVDRATGKPLTLKGVAMMSGEYACVHTSKIFEGPANQTVIDGMAGWGINAIRLPMNEDCWLGLNGANPKTSGAVYQKTFVTFVEQLLGSGFVVVLDLHWTSHTGTLAEGQDLFLSTDSVKFWASVAMHPALHNRPGVVFELFNEPHDGKLPVGAASTVVAVAESPAPDPNCTTGILNMHSCCPQSCGVCGGPSCGAHPCTGKLPCWQQCCEGSTAIKNRSCNQLGPPCHLGPGAHPPPPPPPPTKTAVISSGCYLNGIGCPAAGFAGYNEVVHAIRTVSKATNLILFAGKNWNFDLGWLLDNFPTDPLENCGAAWHPYEFKCRDFSCNANVSGPLTAKYPIFVTEWSPGFPQSNNNMSVPDVYSQRVLDWADAMPGTVQLFPWVWNPGKGKNHVLMPDSSYAGEKPTPWGAQYKRWAPKLRSTMDQR